MKSLLQLLSVCLLPLPTVATEPASPPILQIRLVLDAQSDDAEEMFLVHKGKDKDHTEALYVQKEVLLDQATVVSASATTSPLDGKPRIEIVFSDTGKKRFGEVTRQNVDKRLAIIIDGKLYSAPTIRMEILAGKAEVSGNFSEEEASELAAKILGALHKH